MEARGKQRSVNPNNPGRKSYYPLLVFEGKSRLCLISRGTRFCRRDLSVAFSLLPFVMLFLTKGLGRWFLQLVGKL